MTTYVLIALAALGVAGLYAVSISVDEVRDELRRLNTRGVITRLPGEQEVPHDVMAFAMRLNDAITGSAFIPPDLEARLLDLVSEAAAPTRKEDPRT